MIFNGSKLRELREEKLWSRLELARRLNVSDPQVGRWESGKCAPRGKTVKKIAKVLGVAVSELVAAEEPEKVEVAS
jgi:transcriptional regulator with XRE-family HTH domain